MQSSSSSKSNSFANKSMIRISSHSLRLWIDDDNVVECDRFSFFSNVVECDFSFSLNVVECDFFFLSNVVECDFSSFLSSRNEIVFRFSFALFSIFVKRSRTRIKWRTKNDYASLFNITWFWKDCTWSKIVRQSDESNESKRRRSNVLQMTTNVTNVTNLTNLTNMTNFVKVLPFDPDYQGTGLNPIRKELASIFHKSLFCTIDFLLFFSKSIFSVISTS
jgi:hypothetical protein